VTREVVFFPLLLSGAIDELGEGILFLTVEG
jgi:hypothetical protein